MMLAQIDFQEESWHLITLLIAIFQPVLFLMLIAGLILASAHLLTMIGTRWGDHKAGPKAFAFSIGVHLLLACGIVALLPEYRQRAVANLVQLNDEPIQIRTLPDRTDMDTTRTESGNTPVWEQIKPADQQDWERFQAPLPDLSNIDRALDKPNETPDLKPEISKDRTPLPSESLPVPEQELSAEQGELQRATQEARVETLETQLRPDSEAFSAVQNRAPRPQVGTETRVDVDRPTRGSIDRISTELSPDRQTQSLQSQTSPQANMQQAPEGDLNVRRAGPAPVLPEADRIGESESKNLASSQNSSPVDPVISRTRMSPNLSDSDDPAIGRYRPSDRPTLPDPVTRDRNSSVSSNSQLMPLPGERPQMVLPEDNFLARSQPNSVPSAYLLRSEKLRERAILKYGGSEASENAVDLSLKWLAERQHPDGYWDASRYGSGLVEIDDDGIDRQFAGRDSDTGVTALAVLAFLGKMNTVDEGEYSENVKRALRWLVTQQRVKEWPNGDKTSGYLGGNATQFAGMYCHGMVTFAIAEAYAVSRDSENAEFLRAPLERGINFILATQIDDGGWRYVKGQPDGDMSMFGWQLMAIKSAEAAGIEITFETKRRLVKFLDSRRLGRYGGLAGYRDGEPPSPAMTAEALFCRQILNIDQDKSATDEAVRYLLANRPNRSALNYYYWYYGTLAMYQRGGADWEQWNAAMRDLIVSEQQTFGQDAGSWAPRGIWGPYGGRVYTTAIATLSLEVYYRYLRDEAVVAP